MKEAHRQQRQTLDGNQTKRAGQEEQARAARLRKGVMGLWDRLSGKRGKVSELNARDMAAGRSRDRAERQTLIETRMQERGELQGRIMQMREQHRRDRQDHRAELGAMLSMSKDSVRDRFMEHGQELDARKANPPTAAQTRRDRAEKRGTMPEIVASERTGGPMQGPTERPGKQAWRGRKPGRVKVRPETNRPPQPRQRRRRKEIQASRRNGRRSNAPPRSTPSATVRPGSTPSGSAGRRSSVTGGAMTTTPGARGNPEPGSENRYPEIAVFPGPGRTREP
jgi:hypothetical protein